MFLCSPEHYAHSFTLEFRKILQIHRKCAQFTHLAFNSKGFLRCSKEQKNESSPASNINVLYKIMTLLSRLNINTCKFQTCFHCGTTWHAHLYIFHYYLICVAILTMFLMVPEDGVQKYRTTWAWHKKSFLFEKTRT